MTFYRPAATQPDWSTWLSCGLIFGIDPRYRTSGIDDTSTLVSYRPSLVSRVTSNERQYMSELDLLWLLCEYFY